MKRLVVLGLLCAALAGCADRGRCLASESHNEDQMYVITYINMGGGMMMPVYGTQRVRVTNCTRWEFPEGRP